jgi:histone H1/5
MSDAPADTEVAAVPAVPADAGKPGKKAGGRAKAPASKPVKAAVVKSPKKPRAKTTSDHPKISVMVNGAIKGLAERGGSSLKAIKKYINDTYKVDAEKLAPFIRRYLKSGVTNGALVQVKGKGANGSFRLPAKGATAASAVAGGAAKGIKVKKAVVKPKKAVAGSPKKAKAAAASPKAKAKKPAVAAASPKKVKPAAKAKKVEAVVAAPAPASPAKPKKAAAAVAAPKKTAKAAAPKKSPVKPKTAAKATKKPKSPKPKKSAKPKAAPKKAAPKKK